MSWQVPIASLPSPCPDQGQGQVPSYQDDTLVSGPVNNHHNTEPDLRAQVHTAAMQVLLMVEKHEIHACIASNTACSFQVSSKFANWLGQVGDTHRKIQYQVLSI